ncbi:hypothetical protein Lal_00033633 [Lupinus albus]|nr:hypothetical protein Lal_00033633 [Lupinus albus]
MASSSRTKKQRSSVSQSKQGTSSLESNPLNLTRLLANDEFHCAVTYLFKVEHSVSAIVSNKALAKLSRTEILSVGYLKLEDRLLHYFLSYVILPKFSNHSQISDIELQLMYAMKYNIKINWAQMIMRQMWNVCSSQSPLPYALFITKILELFGVSDAGETKVALNLRESKIDVEVVHKMGFSIDPQDCHTYRHRTDRPTAPTSDQPEPTNPNPLEFHAQSSSSAAMPSKQMIMDELSSLRGYITNWMDALDTQNQRI